MPRALFGGILWGRRAVRFVFTDEAGTSGSPNEDYRIVIGLIVHADQQLVELEAAVNEVMASIPSNLQGTFPYSAKRVWNDSALRSWRQADRIGFLNRMAALPRLLNIPIAFGKVRSGAFAGLDHGLPVNAAQFEHLMAFIWCMARADKFIRENAAPSEIATLVSEQSGKLDALIKIAPKAIRTAGAWAPVQEWIRETIEEQQLGYQKQDAVIAISRIRNTVHFVEKEDEKAIWVADTCAFAMRRWLERQSIGDILIRSCLGNEPPIADYEGPLSGGVFTAS